MQVLFFPRQRFYYTRSTCSTMPMNGASHLPLTTTSGANNITQGSKTGDLSPDEMLLLMRVLLSCCWMDAVIVELTAYNTFAHFLNSYLGQLGIRVSILFEDALIKKIYLRLCYRFQVIYITVQKQLNMTFMTGNLCT